MIQIDSKKEYYVYHHVNKINNDIFYVGKGKGKRAYDTIGRNQYWLNYTKKYPEFEVVIVYDNLLEEEAFELEIKEINKIGRSIYKEGTLVNILPGGRPFPEEYILFRKENKIKYKKNDNNSKIELMQLVDDFIKKGNNDSLQKALDDFCKKNDFIKRSFYVWKDLTEDEKYEVLLEEHNIFIHNISKRGGSFGHLKKLDYITEKDKEYFKKMYDLKEKRYGK